MSTARKTQTADWKSENAFISEKLAEVADLLAAQDAGTFRVRAYREASDFVAHAPLGIGDVLGTGGLQALVDLPTIGTAIAGAISELVETGDLGLIARLRGELDPEKTLQTVPMIGPRLARAIHEDLGIDTLEALEAAAYDGRLQALGGIGTRRLGSIRHSLKDMLSRRRPGRGGRKTPAPPVEAVLDVDREYRRRDRENDLPKITPRRFNPDAKAWLPILHTRRGPWRLTALYSNTPNAHRLGHIGDWVVVYFETEGGPEGQCTVVTETRGPFKGQRVVRGHEPDRWQSSTGKRRGAP